MIRERTEIVDAPFLQISSLAVTYPAPPSEKVIYESFSASAARGEVLAIIGPNGSGKTTLLKAIAGLLPSEGAITIGGRSPEDVSKGFAFQDYRGSLFNWLDNTDNVFLTMPPEARSRNHTTLVDRVFRNAHIPSGGYPYHLSGGQQQMLSALRALVAVDNASEPAVAILDEPFRAMDYHNRSLFYRFFLEMIEERGITTVLVSHDVEEAVYLADRLLILPKPPISEALSVDIQLRRPRTLELQRHDEFFAILRQVKHQFNEILGVA